MTFVLAIGKNDDRIHVGTLETVLPHVGNTTESCRQAWDAFELYDDSGEELEIVDGDDGGTEGEDAGPPQLRRKQVVDDPAEGADPQRKQHLVDRINLVYAGFQVIFNGEPFDDRIPDGRFPVLKGPLPVVLAGLNAWYGDLSHFEAPPHPDTPTHDWEHAHLGMTHG